METETEAPAARAKDPPEDAFERFYATVEDRVYRALAVTLADVHLAREATDEVMARAFAQWSMVKAFDNRGGWVFRVGVNWATSWRRKLHRERAMPDTGTAPAVTATVCDTTAATAALAVLPVPQRAVVVCRVLFGLSTAETAVALSIAEGTVRSRLSRAITALRAELRDMEFPEEER